VTWSDYWKKELLRLGSVFPENALIVGGIPGRASVLPQKKAAGLLVLVPHETDSPKSEVSAFLERILEDILSARVVIKLRPDHPRAEQMSAYPSLVFGGRVSTITELSELTERPSVVLGVYSSFLYDMVRAEVPVLIMDTSMDYGRTMVENGLAEQVLLSDVVEAVKKAMELPMSVLEGRARMLGSEKNLEEELARIATVCGITSVKTVG
jgi:hypothetical protein